MELTESEAHILAGLSKVWAFVFSGGSPKNSTLWGIFSHDAENEYRGVCYLVKIRGGPCRSLGEAHIQDTYLNIIPKTGNKPGFYGDDGDDRDGT